MVLHIIALHETGSNNPIGIENKVDNRSFHPYYTVKDIQAFNILIIVFAILVFFAPNFLGHSDNYIPANPLVTPTHIVPE